MELISCHCFGSSKYPNILFYAQNICLDPHHVIKQKEDVSSANPDRILWRQHLMALKDEQKIYFCTQLCPLSLGSPVLQSFPS